MASLADYMGRAAEPAMGALIGYVIERSPILNYLNLEYYPRVDCSFSVQGQLPQGEYRNIDAAFQKKQTKAPEKYFQQMKDFGGTKTVDFMLAQEATAMGGNYSSRVVRDLARAFTLDVKKNIFGANRQDNGVYGLIDWNNEYAPLQASETLIGFGSGTARAINTGSTADAQLIDQRMMQLELAVRPDFYVTNRNIMTQILAVASNAPNSTLGGALNTERVVIQDPAGMFQPITTKIVTYRDTPILDIGEDSQDNPVFAFDETAGGSSVTSRIMAVNTGESGVTVRHYHPNLVDALEYTQDDNTQVRVSLPLVVEARQKSCVGSITEILSA